MFNSAATELITKPFFSQILCLGGLGLYFWMSIEVSCPALRQSSHYLPAEAPPCWCEVCPVAAGSALLLPSPPCCHGLRPVAVSLCCIGLPLQWQAVSAVGLYLSRGRLPR